MPRKQGPIGPGGSSIPGRRGGMGNPGEEDFYFKGWRDFGQAEERPLDIVHDPTCDPSKISPERKAELESQFCMLKGLFERQVIFTKGPANVQPPWFARPIIKAIRLTVAANSLGVIFTREIPARHRAVLTCLGIDVSPVLPLTDGALEFWFAKDNGQVIPVWDDQTAVAYEEADGLTSGFTSVLPGSLENPFAFLTHGLQIIIKGRTVLTFNINNKSDVAVDIRGIMGYYQYWLPFGATEHENADVQM